MKNVIKSNVIKVDEIKIIYLCNLVLGLIEEKVIRRGSFNMTTTEKSATFNVYTLNSVTKRV